MARPRLGAGAHDVLEGASALTSKWPERTVRASRRGRWKPSSGRHGAQPGV
jgi:hypothetical protein